jgi:hypothetical protein
VTVTPVDGADGDTNYTYVVGEGLLANGVLQAAESDSTRYVPGEGVYVEDQLSYVYSDSNPNVTEGEPSGEPSGEAGQNDTAVSGEAGLDDSTVSKDAELSPLQELLAESKYTTAYNPYTGQYEVYETADLLSGKGEGNSANSALEQQTEEMSQRETDDDFTVNHGIGHTLSGEEQQGFLLLGIISLGGVAVLFLLYRKLFRGKRGGR